MNSGPEQYDWIVQYLKGKLSGPEKSAFEKRMEEDPSFSEEVAMQKVLNELIFEKGLADIKKKVAEDMPPPGTSLNKTGLFSIAGILLTVGCIFFYWSSNKADKGIETRHSLAAEHTVQPDKKTELSKSEPKPIVDLHEIKKKTEKVVEKDSLVRLQEHTVSNPLNNTSNNEKQENEDPAQTVETQKAPDSIEKIEKGSPQTVVQKEATDNPCPGINFEVKTTISCKNQSTGSIEIIRAGIQGGKEPYLVAIDGTDFRSTMLFTDLPAGKYTVTMKDDNACVSDKEINIPEKACVEFKDYSFNPEKESWAFPFRENESGTITITSSFGKPVYTAEIINGNPVSWDGRSQSGEILETGSYIYLAQTRGGEIRQGYIVILH